MLVEKMLKAFREDFCITHFFNPVRYMHLLEIVAGTDTRADAIEVLTQFCDISLGQGVVTCRDTPGFLGNRVGVFALQVGLIEVQAQGLSIEDADAIMGRPMGIPKPVCSGFTT
jgi:3-hydroxyacyl-CoA dehydrogenase